MRPFWRWGHDLQCHLGSLCLQETVRTTPQPCFLHLSRGLAVAEDALEIFGGFAGGFSTVKAGNDFLGEAHLDVHRMRSAVGDFFFECGGFGGSTVGDEVEIGPHEIVGYGHDFAEDFGGGLGDANVVAEAFGHLALAV